MITPIAQRLKAVSDTAAAYALYQLFKPITEKFRTCAHSTAGLVIKAGSSALAKTGAAVFHYTVKGKNGQIAAATDMPALVGTVTAAKFNIFVFFVDEAGTKTVAMGTEAATEATVKWPVMSTEKVMIGYIKINPTGTGNFVGGTTALDDGTVIPGTQYISPTGMMFPTARVD